MILKKIKIATFSILVASTIVSMEASFNKCFSSFINKVTQNIIKKFYKADLPVRCSDVLNGHPSLEIRNAVETFEYLSFNPDKMLKYIKDRRNKLNLIDSYKPETIWYREIEEEIPYKIYEIILGIKLVDPLVFLNETASNAILTMELIMAVCFMGEDEVLQKLGEFYIDLVKKYKNEKLAEVEL